MTEAEFRAAHPGLLEQIAGLTAVQQIELAGWLESRKKLGFRRWLRRG